MAFEITKTFVVRAAPAQVWAFLVDPEKVARCMPGAAITGQVDERTWAGTMTVKVGPVQASYRGKLVFEQLDPATRTAAIVATGQDVRGKGGADLRLTSTVADRGAGQTEVTAVSRVNVSGLLGQMGRGMVEDVGDQVFQAFSQRMRKELEAEGAVDGASATAHPTSTAASTATATATATAPTTSTPTAASSVTSTSSPTSNLTSTSAPTANPTATRVSRPAASEPLDVGALGARVAGRAAARSLSAPTPLWLSLVLAAAVLYLLLRRAW